MTDYLNPHKIYIGFDYSNSPDFTAKTYSDRVDIPPGFDSVREKPTVKDSLTTEPTQIDRSKKLEKEVEQLKKYFECFARFNRLGVPEVEE